MHMVIKEIMNDKKIEDIAEKYTFLQKVLSFSKEIGIEILKPIQLDEDSVLPTIDTRKDMSMNKKVMLPTLEDVVVEVIEICIKRPDEVYITISGKRRDGRDMTHSGYARSTYASINDDTAFLLMQLQPDVDFLRRKAMEEYCREANLKLNNAEEILKPYLPLCTEEVLKRKGK